MNKKINKYQLTGLNAKMCKMLEKKDQEIKKLEMVIKSIQNSNIKLIKEIEELSVKLQILTNEITKR